jgi:hypothetical protein
MRNAYTFLSENLKGRDHLEDLGIEDFVRMDLRDKW